MSNFFPVVGKMKKMNTSSFAKPHTKLLCTEKLRQNRLLQKWMNFSFQIQHSWSPVPVGWNQFLMSFNNDFYSVYQV